MELLIDSDNVNLISVSRLQAACLAKQTAERANKSEPMNVDSWFIYSDKREGIGLLFSTHN